LREASSDRWHDCGGEAGVRRKSGYGEMEIERLIAIPRASRATVSTKGLEVRTSDAGLEEVH
jgi:hypothetical protein